MQKLIITLLFVIVALGVAGFVFWRFFYLATITINPIPTTATITVNGKPTADRLLRVQAGTYQINVSAEGYRSQSLTIHVGLGAQVTKTVELVLLPQPAKLLDGAMHSLALSSDGKTIYFEQGNVLYRHTLNTPIVAPITPQLSDIVSVDWSEDFNLALIHHTGGAVDLYDFNRYDLVHQETKPLGTSVKDTAWISDGSGFYKIEGNDRAIIRVDRAGNNPERLGDLSALTLQNLVMTIGQPQQLFLSSTDTSKPGDIFIFNAHERLLSQLTQSGASYGPVVSPDKKNIVYSENGELVTATIDGLERRNLNVRAKVGNYAFLDATTVVALTANEANYINLATGKNEKLAVFAPSDSISQFSVLPDGRLLYVYQDKLFRLNPREKKTASTQP